MEIEGLNKIEKIRTYETVIEQFVRLITSGQVKPGDKLPTERELSAKLEISRATLREAFRVMESLGIVESRMGSGRYLRTADVSYFGLHQGQEYLALYLSFMEARTYIEVGTVTLACKRAKDADIDRIEKAGNLDLNADNFVRYDTDFHLAITAAAHNPVFEWVMGSQLFSIYFTGVWDTSPSRWNEIKLEHKEIYRAIRKRDPEQAKRAMLHHLNKVEENIIGADIVNLTMTTV